MMDLAVVTLVYATAFTMGTVGLFIMSLTAMVIKGEFYNG